MQRLHGWNERQNHTIEYRSTEGRVERLTELSDDLVRLKVDIVVAGPQSRSRQGYSVPIVFPLAGVQSNGSCRVPQPGSNATGLSLLKTDLAAKRLNLARASPASGDWRSWPCWLSGSRK
jgi:putative ABC transport system substrate-binding protein